MGLSKPAARILLRESLRAPFSGDLLTLGKQDVFFSYRELASFADELGVRLSSTKGNLARKKDLADSGYISDIALFQSLGFSRVVSIDVSKYEGADEIVDLNSPIPENLKRSFDCVVDAGTIEHVFHIPNALNNIFEMLKVGGRVVHMAPSSNHTDHGFYMFSPTLFADFYTANGFEINKIQFYRYTERHNIDPWIAVDYYPGAIDGIAFGGLDSGLYGTLVIATKTIKSTGNKIPQQGQSRTHKAPLKFTKFMGRLKFPSPETY